MDLINGVSNRNNPFAIAFKQVPAVGGVRGVNVGIFARLMTGFTPSSDNKSLF